MSESWNTMTRRYLMVDREQEKYTFWIGKRSTKRTTAELFLVVSFSLQIGLAGETVALYDLRAKQAEMQLVCHQLLDGFI